MDAQPVFVPVTALLETEWVRRSAYGYRPEEVARALRAFGDLPQVTIENAPTVAAALDLAEQGMDLADALHLGRAAGQDAFLTFDRRLVKAAQAAGIDLVQEA